MFKILSQTDKARRGVFETAHGVVQTPCFMNVATSAAIKGGLSSTDLKEIGCQVMLCNTYHLHLRPGEDVIYKVGGLHKITNWSGPILTDSGGFQVFSLSKIRKIEERGVTFASHIDGKRIFIGPEESVTIQSKLASTIAMAFDECIDIPSAEHSYVAQSSDRTLRWHERCLKEFKKLNNQDSTINKDQLLFGINQGCCFKDIRIKNMKTLAGMPFDGYAIGGLSVGETHREMYETISVVEEHMPKNKVRYLMGVGTPSNIIESVFRGVDLFDCVMPSRNGRHGHLNTWSGIININNKKYETDIDPIDDRCNCYTCKNYSKAYLRHLLKSKEVLYLRLSVMHNLYFYNELLLKIRESLSDGTFNDFRKKYLEILDSRI
ncbi:MAG: tRNA guanosine(34) transglycosylase Tgt [Ruminococcaceae bacterium]|nr:tRNA guanosine(34) transglycosylase Tgt [Oscillospiraceae bacterium]